MGDYILDNNEFRRSLKHRRALNGRACADVFWVTQRRSARRGNHIFSASSAPLRAKNLNQQIKRHQFAAQLLCIGKMMRSKAIGAGADDIVMIVIDE
jgi:hypothetical protein